MKASKFLGVAFGYFAIGIVFLSILAAGFALSIDLAQFRYTVF